MNHNPGQVKLRDFMLRERGLDGKDNWSMTPISTGKFSLLECRVVVTVAGEEQEAAV